MVGNCAVNEVGTNVKIHHYEFTFKQQTPVNV
jgi:hypothetical protein